MSLILDALRRSEADAPGTLDLSLIHISEPTRQAGISYGGLWV